MTTGTTLAITLFSITLLLAGAAMVWRAMPAQSDSPRLFYVGMPIFSAGLGFLSSVVEPVFHLARKGALSMIPAADSALIFYSGQTLIIFVLLAAILMVFWLLMAQWVTIVDFVIERRKMNRAKGEGAP